MCKCIGIIGSFQIHLAAAAEEVTKLTVYSCIISKAERFLCDNKAGKPVRQLCACGKGIPVDAFGNSSLYIGRGHKLCKITEKP